ncbi:MAG: hypothetical protein ACXWZW_09845 [Solirubrobacterales bacterium]
MKRTIKTAAVLAAATMLVAAAPATAKKKQASTGNYAGKTAGGANITFKLAKGGKVKNLSSSIFVSCMSAQSSVPKGGVDLFSPPAGLKLGTNEAEVQQPSALTPWNVTKHYTTTLRKAGKTRVTGELKLSFSYLIPDLYYPRIYMCYGTTEFTARRG